MKYSLFFYILFMGLCGIYAASRHIRSVPKDENIISNMTQAVLNNEKLALGEVEPDCPVPPMECPNDDITFWYYSRAIGDNPLPIRYTTSKSAAVEKGPGPWKVLIPGFAQKKEEFPVADLVAAYNEKDMYNMLAVDYYPLAKPECYHAALQNVPLISKCTAELLEYLISTDVFTADQLHVIGFGLGGHIAGGMHEYMKSGQLGRVTGLDPYGLHLAVIPLSDITGKSAVFSDIFHTEVLTEYAKSEPRPAEFFFNSGAVQPSCYSDDKDLLACSHERGAQYYIESIGHAGTDNGFYGIPCEDYWYFAALLCQGDDHSLIKAGEDGRTDASGTFHLQTHHKPPYALGKVYKFDPDV